MNSGARKTKTKKGKWKRRFRQFSKFSVITLGLLFAAWCFENWRGNRAWEKLKREYYAQGQPLDFEGWKKARGEVRLDEDNFFGTPLLKPLFEYHQAAGPEGSLNREWIDPKKVALVEDIKLPQLRKRLGSKSQAHEPSLGLEDLQAVMSYSYASTQPAMSRSLAALDILRGLSKWNNYLMELAEASQRPIHIAPLEREINEVLRCFPWLRGKVGLS